LYFVKVCLPVVVLPVVDAIAAENLVAIVHTPVALKVPPKQLIDEYFCRFVLAIRYYGLEYLLDRKASVGQPRGKFGGVV